VREAPVEGVFDSGGNNRAAASCGERLPYLEGAAPTRLGAAAGGLLLQAVRVTNPAPSESRFRRLGFFFFMGSRITRSNPPVGRFLRLSGAARF
jgi:hypothetical protein